MKPQSSQSTRGPLLLILLSREVVLKYTVLDLLLLSEVIYTVAAEVHPANEFVLALVVDTLALWRISN